MPAPFLTQVAEGIPFDNTNTPYIANDVQHALEETTSLIGGAPRWTLILTYNGTINNGTWIGYTSGIPGTVSPIVIGIKSYFGEFTFSNKVVDADFNLEFYKNGTEIENKFLTVVRTATKYFKYPSSGSIDQLFEANDVLYIKYIDNGANASDIVLVPYFVAYIG